MIDKITLTNINYEKTSLNKLCICKNSPLLMPDAKKVGKYSLYNANLLVGKCDFGEDDIYISIIKYGSGIGKVKLRPPYSNVIGTMGIINQFDNTDLLYLYYYLQVADFKKYIEIGTAPNMYFEDFGELELFIPSKEKQIIIGKLFDIIDNLISNEEQELLKLEQYKKSMLYKMFPKKGLSEPEIRFSNFHDSWKKCLITEFCDRITTQSEDLNLTRIEYEDIISGKGRLNKKLEKKKNIKKGIIYEKDDVLFGKLRPYLKNWFHAKEKGIALGDFWVLRPKKDINSSFLYYFIQTNNYDKIVNVSTGTKMPRADWKLTSSTPFYIPKSYEEQKKIGDFFSELDNLLEKKEKEIEMFQNLKLTLLNKLYM